MRQITPNNNRPGDEETQGSMCKIDNRQKEDGGGSGSRGQTCGRWCWPPTRVEATPPRRPNGLTWGFSVPKPRYVEENAQSRLGSLWSSSSVFNAPWRTGLKVGMKRNCCRDSRVTLLTTPLLDCVRTAGVDTQIVRQPADARLHTRGMATRQSCLVMACHHPTLQSPAT